MAVSMNWGLGCPCSRTLRAPIFVASHIEFLFTSLLCFSGCSKLEPSNWGTTLEAAGQQFGNLGPCHMPTVLGLQAIVITMLLLPVLIVIKILQILI